MLTVENQPEKYSRVSPNSRVILGKLSAKWASCVETKEKHQVSVGLASP